MSNFFKKIHFLHNLKASCISSVSDLHSMAFWTSIRNRIRIQITKLKNSIKKIKINCLQKYFQAAKHRKIYFFRHQTKVLYKPLFFWTSNDSAVVRRKYRYFKCRAEKRNSLNLGLFSYFRQYLICISIKPIRYTALPI